VKYVSERKIGGSIEVMGRPGRRHKQLLDDLKQSSKYCILKKKGYFILLGTYFERGYGFVVRRTMEGMNR